MDQWDGFGQKGIITDVSELPPALQAQGICAIRNEWEHVIFIAQSADDLLWRVWLCFGSEPHMVGGPYAEAEGAATTFCDYIAWVEECGKYYYDRGRRSALPIPPASGTRPVFTLV
ncbi:MAG TPA: hypothetical protein VJ746_06030 [Nitrospira sp.]|nr:hypothetical protein [Nitrospira sp.]